MLTIKIGGNTIWPRGSSNIDVVFLDRLFRYLKEAICPKEKVILVPGGVGGQVFINWGRESGCSEASLNEVGCHLINISAMILTSFAKTRLAHASKVCPSVAGSPREIDQHLQIFDFVVAGCSVEGAVTSDSLAALIAEHTNSRLMIVKRNTPFHPGTSFYTSEDKSIMSLDKIIEHSMSISMAGRAGHNISIDPICLMILKRSKTPTEILLKDSLLEWESGRILRSISIEAESV